MMTVLIHLTTAGADSGPFDLYSNADFYFAPFETNVNKAALTTAPGYLTLAPDGTTIVRVQSVGNCVNHTDILLESIPVIACEATAVSGGAGIAERVISLNSGGGIVIVEVNGQGIPDKFEIVHNGIKKATSGMTVVNGGPFDNVYGTPPSNVIPTEAQVGPIDQFIGTDKGTPPTRNAAFAAANPTLSYITATPPKQLLWWNYTAFDVSINPQVVIRITGPTGTIWDFLRKCPTTTTSSTSSTTTLPPVSTTTTTTAPVFSFNMSDPWTNTGTACANALFPRAVKSLQNPIVVGSIIRNASGNTLFAGGGWWYEIQGSGYVIQINGSGVVTNKFTC